MTAVVDANEMLHLYVCAMLNAQVQMAALSACTGIGVFCMIKMKCMRKALGKLLVCAGHCKGAGAFNLIVR